MKGCGMIGCNMIERSTSECDVIGCVMSGMKGYV